MERFQTFAAPAFGYGDSDAEPATEQLADKGSRAATGRPVPKPHRMLAGDVVHDLTGAGLGLAYGGLVWVSPWFALGFGVLYGLLVGLVPDSLIVPLVGVGDWPWRTHLYGLTSHIVFGLVLEGARRGGVALLA